MIQFVCDSICAVLCSALYSRVSLCATCGFDACRKERVWMMHNKGMILINKKVGLHFS